MQNIKMFKNQYKEKSTLCSLQLRWNYIKIFWLDMKEWIPFGGKTSFKNMLVSNTKEILVYYWKSNASHNLSIPWLFSWSMPCTCLLLRKRRRVSDAHTPCQSSLPLKAEIVPPWDKQTVHHCLPETKIILC